ncbi:MAG: M48 family metalloprotease [Spirochaetaceae bacterium]
MTGDISVENHRSMRGSRLSRSGLSSAVRGAALAAVLAAVLLTSAACSTITEVGTSVGEATGHIDREQGEALRRASRDVERSYEDITPEQEYYIGRSVAAIVLDDYETYDDPEANAYLNRIGQALGLASQRPELFGGYRFQILDSQEINGLATPSGLIFVTRGLLRLADSEDGVAAILAHEIQHIVHQHGLQSIRTSRITTALTSTAIAGAQFATTDEVRKLTNVFDDSVNDVAQTLTTSGYSRSSEVEADSDAVGLLMRVGYDPVGLIRVLERMNEQWESGGPGFLQTHPPPESRIEVVREAIDPDYEPTAAGPRQERYERYLGEI